MGRADIHFRFRPCRGTGRCLLATLLVGDRLAIITPGTAAPEGLRTPLVLVPGAFGSGEHETTAACLEMIEGLDAVAGADVLDLGSGTGVLALAAVLLGARRALCVDIEPRAVATARSNAELNGLADRLEHVCGTLADAPRRRYDLVFANLYPDVLLPLAGELCAAVRPGGFVVLSGILWQDAFEVRERYRSAGAGVLRTVMGAEYTTFLLRVGEP